MNSFFRSSFVAVVCTTLLLSGCSRTAYRQSADRQVKEILNSKTNDARWHLPDTSIEPNRESRFYNADDPDCPPMPPGETAADEIMFRPGGFKGAEIWRTLPRSTQLESPYWPAQFRKLTDPNDQTSNSGDPEIANLTLGQAVELSLVHSREYQTQLENLYLAALNLSYARYRFNVRPFSIGGLEPGSEIGYRQGTDGDSKFHLGPSIFGFSRLIPGGAQFVGELVNNTLWLVGGSNSTTTTSAFAFSLIQPLMRGAGREIVLEDLTQAERNVLYAVRDFARFRKQFFVSTITGGQVAGLQRFLRGFEFGGGSGAPSVGFFPVILRLQKLRNRQYITRTLEYLIDDLKAAKADPLDIARLESTFADSRTELYQRQRTFEDKRDQYKVQLGFPPEMKITLDDSMLKPFEFSDSSITDLEVRLRNLGSDLRVAENRPENLRSTFESIAVDAGTATQMVENDLVRLGEILPANLAELDSSDAAQLRRIVTEELNRFKAAQTEMHRLIGQVSKLKSFSPKTVETDDGEPKVIESDAELLRRKMLVVLRRLGVIQIITRVELIPVRPFKMEINEGVRVAMANRLDLMNRKARVTDARRNLEIAADQLEANVDIIGDATIATKPLFSNSNPIDFRAKRSTYGIGLRFDTPLDRVEQRNRFRAAQIAYDRAKRGFVGTEDNIKLEVRQAGRTLIELNKSLVQLRRRVQYSAREVDLAEAKSAVSNSGGLSLNNALRTLNRANDNLIEGWLDYETTRINLFRDIGTMKIDNRGFWTDEFYQDIADRNGKSK